MHGDCQDEAEAQIACPAGRSRACRSVLTMIDDAPTRSTPVPGPPPSRFVVRSITGAAYTLVEEVDREGAGGAVRRRYRTAYAGLPVVANEDGSFTLVDTKTRLVRVAPR
jgi:hypothetical protein